MKTALIIIISIIIFSSSCVTNKVVAQRGFHNVESIIKFNKIEFYNGFFKNPLDSLFRIIRSYNHVPKKVDLLGILSFDTLSKHIELSIHNKSVLDAILDSFSRNKFLYSTQINGIDIIVYKNFMSSSFSNYYTKHDSLEREVIYRKYFIGKYLYVHNSILIKIFCIIKDNKLIVSSIEADVPLEN